MKGQGKRGEKGQFVWEACSQLILIPPCSLQKHVVAELLAAHRDRSLVARRWRDACAGHQNTTRNSLGH